MVFQFTLPTTSHQTDDRRDPLSILNSILSNLDNWEWSIPEGFYLHAPSLVHISCFHGALGTSRVRHAEEREVLYGYFSMP